MFLPYPKNINVKKIIDNLDIIKEDYFKLITKDFYDYKSVEKGIDSILNGPETTDDAKWQVYPLIFKYSPWPDRINLTIKILENIGPYPLLATFSKLQPNNNIEPHQDHDETLVDAYDTTVVKCHITLESTIGGDSTLTVGGETRILNAGDINFFDESVEHSVSNNGNTSRGVLLISWLRKDLEF
jgi:hypothetical protein